MKSGELNLDGYLLSATPDMPDTRDWIYQAPPIQLKSTLDVPQKLHIRDQSSDSSCTGFGLAAVIDYLNKQRGRQIEVSPRMLYEMARKHDEWLGESYEGSSCRGAIKGFANMGACQEKYWKYKVGKPGFLSIDAAKDARANTIGAYYRLGRRVSDFHAALNQAGILYCSANVHKGWSAERVKKKGGVIPYESTSEGGHAFAIVGYNEKGFWVQNSWGKQWANNGVALWTYEDWHENLTDAWVLNLALPTPQIWHSEIPSSGRSKDEASNKVERGKIAGHFVHIDDGKFHDAGRYWSNLKDVENTAALLAESPSYDHLLIYAHGGLNSPDDSAKRIAKMRDVFKSNRIYPFHFMYDTGVVEEIKDIVVSRGKRADAPVMGAMDMWDRLLERLTRPVGRALWREMKFGARNGFVKNNAGAKTLKALKPAIERSAGLKIHLVGHSTGAILLAHLLAALKSEMPSLKIASCSLLAPAARVDLFESHYLPLLGTAKGDYGVNQLSVYNLTDELELDDTVGPYRKSLLYLVSHAFEESTPAAIIGMQRYSKLIEKLSIANLEFVYSQGDGGSKQRTKSKVHGGFDNDPNTMNDILRRVLGKAPSHLFTESDLDY